MSDIALQENGNDLSLVGHRLNLTTGTDAIAQQVLIRLRFFLAEWFLDERQGIPYFRDILVKNPNLALVRHLYRQAIVTTPGISVVTGLVVDLDAATRKLTLEFAATMDTGEELIFTPFIIEI
jgi:hypothetical protein